MKRTLRVAMCALLCGSSLVACSDDDDEATDRDDGTPRGVLDRLTAVTYNAGLAVGFVDYANERAPEVAAALAGVSQDVLCVQEVWEQQHWDLLVSEIEDALPFTHRLEPDPGDVTNSCMAGELDALAQCADANCSGVATDMLTGCVTESCGAALGAISTTCLDCLIANVGTGDLSTIRTTCETGGGAFAYGGSFGTGILSRYRLFELDALRFDSTANRRAVLYSRLDDTPAGDVHVFCTHLTPIFDETEIPYTGDFGSWQGEQAAQIAELLPYIDEKADGGQVLLLGDLNTGPSAPGGIEAEAAENYEALIAGNLVNAYVEQGDVECTFCTDNQLVSDDEPSVLIDHALVRGLSVVEAERILRRTVDIQIDGETVITPLSDHYGVRAVLQGQ